MTDTQSSTSVLLRLLRYSRGQRRQVWLASICSVLNKLFDVMPEILIGMAIDVVVRQQESWVA
jgi:ATP-binding cassette subfamily B protein